MSKNTKKRAQVKSLAGKKKLSAKDMKKVKGGLTSSPSLVAMKESPTSLGAGLLLPAVQKVRE
jgi:hypothetical protein